MPKPFVPLAKLNYTEQRADSVGFGYNKKQVFRNFVEAVDADIDRINSKIAAFNEEVDHEKRKDILLDITRIHNEMYVKYPLYCISHCPEYQKQIHETLWNSLQEQFQIVEPVLTASPIGADNSFSPEQMISVMSPAKLSQFMRILWENSDGLSALRTLYNPREKSIESENYFKFLSTYSLSPITLSEEKNSQIIRIQSLVEAGPPLILKMESRDGLPKQAEKQLSEQGADYLVSTKRERQAVFLTSNQPMAANLVLEELCHKGDLLHISRRSPSMMDTLRYFTQMAFIFTDLQKRNIAFPDAKIENWLVNSDNQLKIGDAKSFFFTTPDGRLDFTSPANQWSEILSTQHLMPPEVLAHVRNGNDPEAVISADKLHSYQLGKNLYEYLTQCGCEALIDKHQFEPRDFEHGVFKKPPGEKLMELIQNMVRTNPEERLSSQAALQELRQLFDAVTSEEIKSLNAKIDKTIESIRKMGDDVASKISTITDKRSEYNGNIDALQQMQKSLVTLYTLTLAERRATTNTFKAAVQQPAAQPAEQPVDQQNNLGMS